MNTSLNNNMPAGSAGLSVSWEGLRRTRGGRAADLIISKNGAGVKYNVYLRGEVVLHFTSANRGRAELAARLLRLAGVGAEARRAGGGGVWYVIATTDRLTAGRRELRKALAEVVAAAAERLWVNAGRARRWLRKLERGRALREGWPKYYVVPHLRHIPLLHPLHVRRATIGTLHEIYFIPKFIITKIKQKI
jgi:hypothetical protein